MPIHVAGRRRSRASIESAHPGAMILDVTSRAEAPWVRLSPFYPHGGIPVPFSPGVASQSVEGVWQALKVFTTTDVDPAKLEVTSMKGLKRTAGKYGDVLGHREGVNGEKLLSYEDARRRIYLPVYRWVLEHRTADLISELRLLSRDRDVVLLDYTTNGDVADSSSPLSHAALVGLYVEDRWPADRDGT